MEKLRGLWPAGRRSGRAKNLFFPSDGAPVAHGDRSTLRIRLASYQCSQFKLEGRRKNQSRASIAFWISRRAAATLSATFLGRNTCRSWSVWRGFVRRSSSSPRSSRSRAAWRCLRTDSDDWGAFKCWRGKRIPRPRLARPHGASHDSITRIIPERRRHQGAPGRPCRNAGTCSWYQVVRAR